MSVTANAKARAVDYVTVPERREPQDDPSTVVGSFEVDIANHTVQRLRSHEWDGCEEAATPEVLAANGTARFAARRVGVKTWATCLSLEAGRP